jgi:hypothetical protein
LGTLLHVRDSACSTSSRLCANGDSGAHCESSQRPLRDANDQVWWCTRVGQIRCNRNIARHIWQPSKSIMSLAGIPCSAHVDHERLGDPKTRVEGGSEHMGQHTPELSRPVLAAWLPGKWGCWLLPEHSMNKAYCLPGDAPPAEQRLMLGCKWTNTRACCGSRASKTLRPGGDTKIPATKHAQRERRKRSVTRSALC